MSAGKVAPISGGSALARADSLCLRPVRAEDLDVVATLQERAIMRFGALVYGEAKAKAWARLGVQFRRDLLGDGFWVAEEEDRIRGVGGWSPDGLETDLAWLRYLFVDPQAVGRGIGRRLVTRAESAAQAAGRPRIHVWSSLNAVGFYRAVGYLEQRRARWPIEAGIELDHVLMTKRAGPCPDRERPPG
jgi:GNAT superfamily N-acetyltransferase